MIQLQLEITGKNSKMFRLQSHQPLVNTLTQMPKWNLLVTPL